MSPIKLYFSDTKLNFGIYRNKTLLEVAETQHNYINFCILNLNHFCISSTALENIKKIVPKFILSAKEYQINSFKNEQWLLQEEEYKKSKKTSHDHGFAYNWDEHTNDLIELGYSEDYYDDNLDMDQQDERFYTTMPDED